MKYPVNNIKKITAYIVLTCMLFVNSIMSGCGESESQTHIVITTVFSQDEVFKIGEAVCTLPEVMLYITDLQKQYEKVYGDQIWNTRIDGVSLEDNVKEIALARISQVKAVSLMAEERGIKLDDDEQKAVDKVTDIYYSSLKKEEIEAMGISKGTVHDLYEEYALSQKLYESIIKDVNPEISDDEARTITVQNILIRTYSYDDNGTKVPYDSSHKEAARQLAQSIRERLLEGEEFESLAEEYSDADEITISFGKGEMDTAFEVAAFELASGEISDVIETDYGYHVIKCISTFNREVTDSNKLKIVEQRKQEAFNGEYENYVASLTKKLNEELWESVSFIPDIDPEGAGFLEVFEENY